MVDLELIESEEASHSTSLAEDAEQSDATQEVKTEPVSPRPRRKRRRRSRSSSRSGSVASEHRVRRCPMKINEMNTTHRKFHVSHV